MEGNVATILQELGHLMSPCIAGWICFPCGRKREKIHPVPEFSIAVIHPFADFPACAVVVLPVAGALGWRIQPDEDCDGSFTIEMREDTEAGVVIISDDVLSHQIEINDQTEIGCVFGDCTNLRRRSFFELQVTIGAAGFPRHWPFKNALPICMLTTGTVALAVDGTIINDALGFIASFVSIHFWIWWFTLEALALRRTWFGTFEWLEWYVRNS